MNRGLDLVIVLGTAPITLPVGAGVAVLLRLVDGPPVLFRQERVGLNGARFQLLKFRTMREARDPVGRMLPDRQRLTVMGRWLRKLSLDELPQLINVARGDMSLVGPRPLLAEYLPAYTAREHRRHEVRPGITGLAQVSGRNHVGWQQRLELDVQYVESRTLRLDLWILLKTLRNALGGGDVAIIAGDTGQPLHLERSHPTREGYRLRRLYERDLEARVDWISSPTVRRYMQLREVSAASTKEWFARVRMDPSRVEFAVVDAQDRPVAMTGLKQTCAAQEAEFYIIVDPARQGHGIGRLSTELTVEWACSVTFSRTLVLTVHRSNEAAIRIYESMGFGVYRHTEERLWMRLDL